MPPKIGCYSCGKFLPKDIYTGPKKQFKARLERIGWVFGGMMEGITASGFPGTVLGILCPDCKAKGDGGE